ncbi:MAG: MBL fold metallo-hydrolase [Desulfuromonadales bacterium]|nr:MBL fold metallo-hydrolase [Desulfuromonadales bacterium]
MDALRQMRNLEARPGLQELAPGFFFMDTLDRGVKGYVGGWVVQGRRSYVLVETGAGAAVPRWLSALADAGIPLERIEWILLTHVHLDHAGGAAALLQHLPNARIGVHPDGIRHLLNPERLMAGAKQAWGDDFERLGPMLPAPAERVVPLADGELIEVGNFRRLRVLHTPGHTPHHAVFFEETTRGVFSGDALGAIFGGAEPFGEFVTIPGISPPIGDPQQYLASIRRIAELSPRRIYAAHFGLWEPALPYIHLAAGQISLLWEMCREVKKSGGTLGDAQERMATMIARTRLSTCGQAELEKNTTGVVLAVWNHVTSRELIFPPSLGRTAELPANGRRRGG